MRHLLGERGQLAFQSVYPLLERPDLVTQRGQTGAQGHRDGRLRIFDQRADLWDDVARAHWYRHAKLAEQSAQRIEPRRPGPDPRRAHAMEGRDGLLRHRLDRHRMDLLVPGRFEQRFRIRAIGLIATDIPAGLMRGQQLDGVAELFQGARPMVRRPAGFEQHGRGRALGEEPQEPGPGQPMLFIHTPRVMRDRHLKHGLGEVNGDRCMLHLDSSSAVARRGRFTTGTMMPHQREESIPSLVAGLSLSHSRGLGEYAGVAAGQVASAVTGLYPWLGYKATDRVTVWGVAGYGRGGLLLTPDSGTALESGLSMAMAAAGTRGELIAGAAGGFVLAFKADALWVGTAIDGVDGPAGRLKATNAAVTRFRTGLEGSRDYALAGRLSLRPSVEVGLRHDGGDAETGAGMDVGAGLIVSDASTGLAVDVRVRTLLVHQAEGFRERGLALSLSYNPTPSTPLGLTARVAPSWGGQATSGAEALWGRETMGGMAHGGLAQGNRLDGEVGYGLPVGSRFVGTPTFGVGTSADGRDYRLGYRLGALGGEGTAVELGVDAQRRERPLQGGTDHGALARATVHW